MAQKKSPIRCGLIMPISSIDGCSEAHWESVRWIIEESLEGTDTKVELVSDADEVGVIQKRIVQNLFDSDIVVCDVSCKNPNVMFELGMRLAFDRPAVIIKDDLTPYSFDTAPVEHLTYPRGLHYHQIQEFKAKLASKVQATLQASADPNYTTFLKHFGKFVVAGLEEKEVGKDAYILDALSELRTQVTNLRAEVRTPISVHAIDLGEPRTMRYMTAEDFLVRYLGRSSSISTKADEASLKNPDSELFNMIWKDYMNQVISKVVNPKPRHEAMARDELLAAVYKVLGNSKEG